MPASYNYTVVTEVEVDPIATLRSALKYTSTTRIQNALDHILENRSVSTDDLAGFFLIGRRAQGAIFGLEQTVATRKGPFTGAHYLTKRAKRRLARAFAAELAMRASGVGPKSSASSTVAVA